MPLKFISGKIMLLGSSHGSSTTFANKFRGTCKKVAVPEIKFRETSDYVWTKPAVCSEINFGVQADSQS